MDIKQLKEIFELTAQRSVLRQYRYHKLNRERLSEAEVRNVMIKILEENKAYYGIEIATKTKQVKEKNVISRSALVDLVIYDSRTSDDPYIFIEFKRGHPTLDKIEKDFLKMMHEPEYLRGACFFHILPKSGTKTTKSQVRAQNQVIKKYFHAYLSIDKSRCIPKWFILFILDTSSRKYYYFEKENICDIERFDIGVWTEIKYG